VKILLKKRKREKERKRKEEGRKEEREGGQRERGRERGRKERLIYVDGLLGTLEIFVALKGKSHL
jgi:hypothetical protein